jgi:hypothetical protein
MPSYEVNSHDGKQHFHNTLEKRHSPCAVILQANKQIFPTWQCNLFYKSL